MLPLTYYVVTQWYSSYRKGRINAQFFLLICSIQGNELVLYHPLK